MSGIKCKGVPLNFMYNTTGGDDTSFYKYTDAATAANIYVVNKKGFSAYNLYLDTASAYTPVIIIVRKFNVSLFTGILYQSLYIIVL